MSSATGESTLVSPHSILGSSNPLGQNLTFSFTSVPLVPSFSTMTQVLLNIFDLSSIFLISSKVIGALPLTEGVNTALNPNDSQQSASLDNTGLLIAKPIVIGTILLCIVSLLGIYGTEEPPASQYPYLGSSFCAQRCSPLKSMGNVT